ncbi:MAG: hypothetical protein IT373_14965 [Polyangiaceae bacterium]|nr:hypothetical protein [Polyangiaceae bacterium]
MHSSRPGILWVGLSGAGAVLAFSAPGLAQNPPPTDCMVIETQAECHARLGCRADEQIEECKARLRGQPQPKDDDADRDRDRDDDQDRDRDRDRDDDRDRDRERRERERERARRDRDRDSDDGGGSDGGDILRPGTRPWFFAGGFGPSILLEGRGGYYYGPGRCFGLGCRGGRGDTQFMLQFEIGYHFSGDSSGPALGLATDLGFGGPFRAEPGLKFWYDIGPIADMGIYITPTVQLGYGYINQSGDAHAFNVQIGTSLRIVLGDRGLVYVQPFCADIHAKTNVLLTHNIIFGGGVTF